MILASRLAADRGQTLGEYAILIGVIAIVVVAAAVLFGSSVSRLFNSTGGHL